MAIKTYNPITPGQRFRTGSSFEELTSKRPVKSLTKGLKKNGGRNNLGRMTMRRRGGGHKRLYRSIDFKRGYISRLSQTLGWHHLNCFAGSNIMSYLKHTGFVLLPREV